MVHTKTNKIDFLNICTTTTTTVTHPLSENSAFTMVQVGSSLSSSRVAPVPTLKMASFTSCGLVGKDEAQDSLCATSGLPISLCSFFYCHF